MSTTIAAVVVNLLSVILPYLGVEVGSEALTTTVATLLAVGSGIWIWYQRVSRGDVTMAGFRK